MNKTPATAMKKNVSELIPIVSGAFHFNSHVTQGVHMN